MPRSPDRGRVAIPVLAATLLVVAGGLLVASKDATLLRLASAEAAPARGYACDPCRSLVDEIPSHSHFENHLAVSPTDPDHLLSAAMWNDGGPAQSDVFVSRDGGLSWSRSLLPYGDRVPPTHPLRAINMVADPAIAIGPDGETVVFVGVGMLAPGVGSTIAPTYNVLFTARSTDGGLTFPAESVLVHQRSYVPFQDFSDHPRITSGPDGLFLMMWNLGSLPDPTRLPRFVATGGDVNHAASIEAWFSASRDGGLTWTEPALAWEDGETLYMLPSPVILRDGSWAAMPSESVSTLGGDVFFTRSTDEGRTWTWEPTGIWALTFGTLATSPVSDRMFFSFNEPTDSLNWVWPSLAVSDGLGQPWTTLRLTDEPIVRVSNENMVAVDGYGTPHVLLAYRTAGESQAEVRLVSVDEGGNVRHVAMERTPTGSMFSHYLGVAGRPDGVAATWNSGGAPWQLVSGIVRAEEP